MQNKIFLFFALLAFDATVNAFLPQTTTCLKSNEEYLASGPSSSCEKRCETPTTAPICYFYKPGCYCKQGFLRDAAGNCIAESTCLQMSCKIANEEYLQSGPSSSCEKRCETPTTAPICYFYKPGCYCKQGFLRDAAGNCIAESTCLQMSCKIANEEYLQSGPSSSCEKRCETPTTAPICFFYTPGCYCKQGFLRDAYGNCIAELTCLQKSCKIANEEYLQSGPSSSCEKRCETPTTAPICFFYTPGCYCKQGYLRDAYGNCIAELTCLQKSCKIANEVYLQSGPSKSCEKKCETPTTAPICYFYQPGCYCNTGYLRDAYGNCIAESICLAKK
ncbi:rh5-interacting protein-like [Chironomus tepperi]|uniref:rh5-interacting protein-like n=1 Tax=Chironomus tepperi TaxID=113505 RepID=UPI00391F528F